MKIDFISDLHADFWLKEKDISKLKFKVQLQNFTENIIMPADSDYEPGEVLIIAGDLGHYNNQTKALLVELKKIYNDIIIVFGNHDMYLVSNRQISKYDSKSENRLIELKEICEDIGVHYLDGNVIEINGVTFGGTGSWYNLETSANIETWKKVMNDSRKIYSGFSPRPYGNYYGSTLYEQPTLNWKTQDFWLKEKAKLIEIAKEKCDVFVTHVALNEPTKSQGMNDEYVDDPDNIFYYTQNIEILKMSGCKIHVHGHTHNSLDYIKEDVRILCNPLGYPSDETYAYVKSFYV